MNNKGASLVDGLFIVVILLVLSIAGFVLHSVFSEANDKIQGSNLSADSKAFNSGQFSKFPKMLDSLFLIIFVGLSIAVFIGAFFLQSHPVFFIFGVLILAFLVIVGAILGNTYEEFVADSTYSAVEAQYTIIPFVMNNFVTIVMGLGFLLIIGLFAKSRGEPI